MSFVLWFVAIVAAVLAVVVSLAVGRTPVTEGLFGLGVAAGLLGFAVDRLVRR